MSARSLAARRLAAVPPVYRVVAAAAHPTRRGQRLSATWRALRYEVMTRGLGRPTVVPLGERSRLIAYQGETNTPKAVVANPPNFPDMLVWRQLLEPGDLFVDVGANIGAYTIWAAEAGADVIAVEPNEHNAGRVREHLALNGYEADVLEVALADKPGTLHITTDRDSLNHLTDAEHGQPVEVRTLDDVLGDRAAYLKVDVEGAEELVLRGAARALDEQRLRLIQLEWETDEHMVTDQRAGLADLLSAAGYELLTADRDGSLHPFPDPTVSVLNVFARPVR